MILRPVPPIGPRAFPRDADPRAVYHEYGAVQPYFVPVGAVPESVTGGPSKTYRIPGWMHMSDVQRVRLIRSVIEAYQQHPQIRKIAADIVSGAGVEARDYVGQARALLSWVQQNIRYFNERGEILQDPLYTIQQRVGDCDDLAIVLLALAESIHLPTRLVLSGQHKSTGKVVRWIEGQGNPMPGVKWAHIYGMIGNRPFNPTAFAFAEPTIKGVALGWDVVQAKAGTVPMPELGAAMTGDALQRKGFWDDIDWKYVKNSVIAGAVSAAVGYAVKTALEKK